MFDVYWKHLVNGRPETTKLTLMPVCLEDATRWANRLTQFKMDGVEGFQDIVNVFVERSDEELRTGFLLAMMGAIHEVVAARREACLEEALEAGASRRHAGLEEEVEVIVYLSPQASTPPEALKVPSLRSSEHEAAGHRVAAV